MSGTHLRVIAEEYASQGLSTIVLSPRSKSHLVRWKSYQHEPPSTFERDAMFSFEDKLNIGVGGAASQNLVVIDAETTRAFETQLRRCEQAGVADTWIDETSRGGHILTRLPTAVKPKFPGRRNHESINYFAVVRSTVKRRLRQLAIRKN